MICRPKLAPTRRRAARCSLADEEAVKAILVGTVFGLWDIVNNLTRLRPTKRERYRVTIFGSARAKPGTFVYDEVKRVAAALARDGLRHRHRRRAGPDAGRQRRRGRGQCAERNRSVGIRVDLPFEQDVNPFVEQAFEHKTFFTPPAPFRAGFGRLRRRPGRDRHGARNA